MPSFEPGFIAAQPISQGLLQTIRQLGEFQGKQDLFARQSPQVLELLRQTAVIQSTESSNCCVRSGRDALWRKRRKPIMDPIS